MERVLMSGNEAIARGSFEAGCRFTTGYPGTPSTEILESIAGYEGIFANWAVNEKVALETASGACLAGARSIVTMKHVGLNVASDPLMTLAYTGVGAGLVVVSADDHGIHSSQNEQDNRWYTLIAKIPILEPSDSEEARLFTVRTFEISERFDLPVLLRMTTRVSHSTSIIFPQGPVRSGQPTAPGKDPGRKVMVPSNARRARRTLEGKLQELGWFSEQLPLNRTERGTADYGIITAGISYQYVKEVAPHANVLKIALTNPLPAGRIQGFARDFRKVLVVEELDPFLEMQIKHLSPGIRGKEFVPSVSELTPDVMRDSVRRFTAGPHASEGPVAGQATGMPDVLQHSLVLCPGVPTGVSFTS